MSKSIVDKLKLQQYKRTAVLHLPEGEDGLAGLENADTVLKEGSYDLIFAFVLDMASLQRLVGQVIREGRLNEGGYLYAAYPKKGNKVYDTYIHRDSLLAGLNAGEDGYIGGSGIKFARMVGFNDVFTVVGFKADAKGKDKPSARPSQSVADYAAMIPNIEEDLRDAPDTLVFYRSLTPGYRRDWARYVYSAVQEETRAKRREEMIEALNAGYKSMDLYRRR